MNACDYVSDWLVRNHERLGLKQIRLQRTEVPAPKFSAWYEANDCLVDICVWDHAHCLDILVLEKSSDSILLSEAGSCGDVEGLQKRLDLFANWAGERTAGA